MVFNLKCVWKLIICGHLLAICITTGSHFFQTSSAKFKKDQCCPLGMLEWHHVVSSVVRGGRGLLTTSQWYLGGGGLIIWHLSSASITLIVNFMIFLWFVYIRPFKKTEVLLFGTVLSSSHYLVHLVPIGIILSKIDQYLDLPHQLQSFRVLVHMLTLAEMGDYTLGWSCSYDL